MDFKPKSRDELARESLLPDGVYDFEVISAEDAVSKSGNDMIKLKLAVFRPDGSQAHLYDYLLTTQEWKLAAFCDAIGKSEDYDAGHVETADLQGAGGRCKIATEAAKLDDDGNEKWPPKNKVKNYVPKTAKDGARQMPRREQEKGATNKPAEDESIPF